MNKNGIECGSNQEMGTCVYVAIDGKYVGDFLISDEIKEDSKKAIKELKQQGVKEILMLTGDRKNIAKEVSEKLEIDNTYAELLPNEKVEKIEELLKEKNNKEKLAFVGDGINDAPALVISDIGIAMGALGSDAAIEAADVVIMTDEPSKIVNAIKLSKNTMRIVIENIVFAISVKIAILILSSIGIATMWEAVFADVGVSIIAIINALRILKFK